MQGLCKFYVCVCKEFEFCSNWFGIICLKFLVNVPICPNSIQNYNLRKDNRANSTKLTANLCELYHWLNVLYVALFYLPGESEKRWGVWRTVTSNLAIRLL